MLKSSRERYFLSFLLTFAVLVSASNKEQRVNSDRSSGVSGSVSERASEERQGDGALTSLWKTERYKKAARLALELFVKKGTKTATAFVCWDTEERHMVKDFSDLGVTLHFIRGRGDITQQSLNHYLQGTSYKVGVLVDMACLFAEMFLEMASRLRIFSISVFWIIFEDGRLKPSLRHQLSLNSSLFDEFKDVLKRRFGAQNREDAIDEEVFLEVNAQGEGLQSFNVTPMTSTLSEIGTEVLGTLLMLIDSDVTWVQPKLDGLESVIGVASTGDLYEVWLYEIFRSCMVRPLQAYLLAAAAPGEEFWRWVASPQQAQSVTRRRANLEGAALRSVIFIMNPEEYTHIEDNSNRKYDIFVKIAFPILKNLGSMLNVNMLIFKRVSFGYAVDKRGNFGGILGELQRYELDMLAMPIQIRAERLPILDASAEIVKLNTLVFLRQYTRPTGANIYILPFSKEVWWSLAAMSLIGSSVLLVQTQWWKHHPDSKEHGNLSASDCVVFIIGALSQQGFYRTPSMVSARLTIVTVLVACFFLFTSFAASILAIIQTPTFAIKTPQDLLASPMEIGAMNTSYQRYWFEGEKEGVVAALYKAKIRPHGDAAFMPAHIGIRRVRQGGYAFQVEANEGHQEILDTFKENEKCDLSELELFPRYDSTFVTVKRSPYREAITRAVRWQRESGHFSRTYHMWETARPKCLSGAKGFVPIGFKEFYPILVLLYSGMVLSIGLLLVEKMWKRK